MLTLFHTAESNIAIFETAAKAAGETRQMNHVLRDDLLKAAEAAGGLTEVVRADCRAAMQEHAGGPVVCTCSTIGPAADDRAAAGQDIRRVDRALAEVALNKGNRIAVLYAVSTTEGPTRRLFEDVARETGADARIDMILVDGAWDLFRSGDPDGYFARIAEVADGLNQGYDVIALAQASMAPAAERCRRQVLTSPAAVFASA